MSQIVSGDRPLTDPNFDRLGYASFAEHLANSITELPFAEGLVIALHGPWGSGKTTVLNFVEHYLNKAPEAKRPLIIHFNPWWFSDDEVLTRKFFDQLSASIQKWRTNATTVIRQIADFSEAVAEIPLPYASSGKAVSKVLKGQSADVSRLKEQVSAALKRQKKHILVVVDDIDRLTAEETWRLFRIVKALANFPNLIYLLVFDRNIVASALSEIQTDTGEAYLEKIIQVPFELPLPDKTSLRKMLFVKLDAILADASNRQFDSTHWGNIYFEGIDPFIETPRDIVRLINALSMTYSIVRDEVNPVDFIAIEALRVFSPTIYDTIRKNPDAFAGFSSTNLHRSGSDKSKAAHDVWLEQVPATNRESVKKMLLRLFPKLHSVWSNTSYGSDFSSQWRRDLRICHPDIFPVYFRLAVPAEYISTNDMKAILADSGSANIFAQRLVELTDQKLVEGSTRVTAFLERFQDHTEKDIPEANIPQILLALFDVGDKLLNSEESNRSLFGFGNGLYIGRIIWQLLKRIERTARYGVLSHAVSEGKALSIISDAVIFLGQQHGKYEAQQTIPEEDRMISLDELTNLEAIFLSKIRLSAEIGELLTVPEPTKVLALWRHWNGDEVKQWATKLIESDQALLNFMVVFLIVVTSQSVTDVVAKHHYRLDPQRIAPYVDPTILMNRLSDISTRQVLSEKQNLAVNQFKHEYSLRQQGKDPDDLPFAADH